MKSCIKYHRLIATFLLLIFIPTVMPTKIFASNNGPNAPEAASFEPVDATDMVSLPTGDMAYVLPLLNVPSPEGGYPIILSYHGGIGFDQESSMIGLGWNLNPGSINRNVNGVPDDWKGAPVRDKEHFESWSKSVELSVGTKAIDAAIGYSWDSNGTTKGTFGIGVGKEYDGELRLRAGIGVGYSNKTGLSGNASASVGTKNGFGVGVYADTDGYMSVGFSQNVLFGGNDVGGVLAVGISLSSNKGKVGVGLTGGNAILNNNSGNSNVSSFGLSAGMYLYGFFVKFGYQQSTYTRDKNITHYIYGPLYYSTLSNAPQNAPSEISYPETLIHEHDRFTYMDAYNQPIPEYIGSSVSYKNAFDNQRFAYNAPSYDAYEVNAQGLSGRMSPRLLNDGLIINPGIDVQYAEEHGSAWECSYDACGGNHLSPSCLTIQGRGFRVSDKRIYVNSHYSNLTNHKFNNTFGQPNSKLCFYFDYQFPADLRTYPSSLNSSLGSNYLESYFTSFNTVQNRKENSDYIETFTNNQITNGNTNGQFLEAKGYNRQNDQGYRPDGIGGYKITTIDGKTYHYSRPVYQFEQIYRQLAPKDENNDGVDDGVYAESDGNYREVRKTEPYATHWLLTAITGPDYVKMSNDKAYPDEGDYGYWVRFDYGKWTDGYIWRTPYNNYDNISNNTASIQAEYSWGRKQLVYLDKVVTRTHTALFVKSIRQDDIGKSIVEGEYPTNESDNSVSYLSQRTLKLDKIVLLKNSDFNNSVETNTQFTNITNEPTSHTANWSSMNHISYLMNQQLDVIDNGDFITDPNTGTLDIYSKALKVIVLNQNYDLAKNSPNSTSPDKGRLTLNSVEVLGKGGTSFMPPYSFEYLGKQINYNADTNQKDNWGYYVNDPTIWTLNKINTPIGSSVEFEFEKDEYYTEAYSRRMFDEDNLQFKAYKDSSEYEVVEFQKSPTWTEPINFLDYFSSTDPTWGSLYCCHNENSTMFQHGDKDWLSISGQAMQIKSVSANNIIFYVPSNRQAETFSQVTDGFKYKGGWHCFIGNQCGEDSNSSWTFNFKVMANKVPGSGFGGGIRVAKINTVCGTEKLVTEYNYNHPTKNRTSGITSYAPSKGIKYVAYRTELPGPRVMYEYVTLTEKGINNETLGKTQYQFNVLNPVFNVFDSNLQEGDHFKSNVYINELNWSTYGVNVKLEDNFATVGSVVKVSQINKAGQIISQVKNNYLTLDELKDNSVEKTGVLQESFHSMKSIYDYENNWLSGMADIGIINWNESCDISENIVVNKRIATSSTKITYPLVQNRKEVLIGNSKKVTEFKKIDPKTGMFLESYTTFGDGKTIKTEQVPAYTKYPEMGSKVTNPNNKHMLSQEAMNIVSVSNSYTPNYLGSWLITGANITTWNKNWSYRDNKGFEDNSTPDIWRKHKSFVYKVSNSSSFSGLNAQNTQFDWANEIPTNAYNGIYGWLKTSEITKYNHFSLPLEVKDINSNTISSKMADNNTKVIVSGNARYTEMYYSGAEYVDSGNWFEGEVQGANFISQDVAHTGKFSVKATNNTDAVFQVDGKIGDYSYYTSPNYSESFRPGKYKVSVWALSNLIDTSKSAVFDQSNDILDEKITTASDGTVLMYNGNKINIAEVVNAGCWTQYNFYVDLISNTNASFKIINEKVDSNNNVYYDDFRIHPISSSINSYVYDFNTDALTFGLDSNNMGTAYKYDDAGRLIGKYVELSSTALLTGGFKIISQYKQKYKGTNYSSNILPSIIDNCFHSSLLYAGLDFKTELIGTSDYEIKINTIPNGGSGNYSYKYKWLTDYNNKIFTNYASGTSERIIPYSFKQCDEDRYSKVYLLLTTVTDNITNKSVENKYVYETECNSFTKFNSSIQVSKLNSICGNNNYNFKIFPTNGFQNNYSYQYSTTTTLENEFNNYNTVFGDFCPDWKIIQDPKSSTGYSKYTTISYKVFDSNNIEFDNAIIIFFGDEVKNEDISSFQEVIPNERVFKNYLEQKENCIYRLDSRTNDILDIHVINQK